MNKQAYQPGWVKLRKEKGSVLDLIAVGAIAFVFIMVIIVFIKLNAQTNAVWQSIVDNNPSLSNNPQNATLQVETAIGNYNAGMAVWRWGGSAIVIMMFVSIIISAYLARQHPIFAVVFFFLWIIAVVVAIPISNMYEQVRYDPNLSDAFAGFQATDFIFLNLPVIISIVGAISMILTFTAITIGPSDRGVL